MNDVFDASCRVNVQGARGSGTFVGAAGNDAYILTNYHVVEGQNAATCDFWSNGVKESVQGRVVWRAYDSQAPADFAIIAVDANQLKQIDPPFVALGGADAKPSVNSFFLTSGGPKGWNVRACKGKILDYWNGETALFQPPPVPGQSGSGIFEEIDGECWLVAIVTWLIGQEGADEAKGGAIPVANLYKALKTRPFKASEPIGSPIPPGAVECVEQPRASILVFSQDGCPPCAKLAPEVERLKSIAPADVPVVEIDAADNPRAFVDNNVLKTPTVLIVSNGVELARLVGDEIKGADFLLKEVDRLAPCLDDCDVNLPFDDPSDFRDRAALYDSVDDRAAGFFEDSCGRWNGRGGTSTPKETPKEDAPNDAALGDRIAARVVASLLKAVDAKAPEINARVGAAVDEAAARAEKKITAARRFLIFWGLVGVVAGNLIAFAIKGTVKTLVARLCSYIVNLQVVARAAVEAAKAVKNESHRTDD